jgi:hypothetical protein
MHYREAVRNLGFYLDSDPPNHFFVGFNALTRSEETIFQELIAEEKAEVIWDMDQEFFEDPLHSAAHFIRSYYDNWKVLKKERKPRFPNHFSKPKTIEIIGAVKNVSQAQIAIELATKIFRENPNESTVLVLGDENLLHPTLSVLPQEEIPWNVTMGYPLRDTTLFSFYSNYFELYQSKEEGGYSLNRVTELIQYAQIDTFLEQSGFPIKRILNKLEKNKQRTVPIEVLIGHNPTADLLFMPFDGITSFLNRMLTLSDSLIEFYQNLKRDPVLISCSDTFDSIWNLIEEYHLANSHIQTIADIRVLFNTWVQQEKLDFTGDAHSGLQIMGVLETRLLDFDNVIITHLNEGILPFGKTPFSWIPFDVRKKFGMNTFIEQDHLYAYHIFRLLQRTKKIHLLYNSIPEGLFSGEKSRFLVQLEYFRKPNHKLIVRQQTPVLEPLENKPKEVIKTPAILSHLNTIAEEGFSPSSLTQYIRNPYLFYEQRMLKIKPIETLENHLNAADKGTLIHEVLEKMYKPYLNEYMRMNDYEKMLSNLDQTLEDCFRNKFNQEDYKTGKNFLIYNVTHSIIKNFLLQEKAQIEKGNQLKIIALEQVFLKSVNLKNSLEKINLKGTVDRIDEWNGSIRFVDYKTGNVEAKNLTFYQWEELLNDTGKSALFQVLLYAYALREDYKDKQVTMGVIPLKNFDSTFLPVIKGENNKNKTFVYLNDDVYDAFGQKLQELFSEIYNPSLSFLWKD